MNVIDLVRRAGIEPRRVSSNKGGEYQSSCPMCGDGGKGQKSNRFHIWPEQRDGMGSFWCRMCKKGGDRITLVMEMDGLSYTEACAALGIDVKSPPPVPLRPRGKCRQESGRYSPSEYQSTDDKWRAHAGKFAAWAHERLVEDHPDVMHWLADRGIDPGTAIRWQLGWNPGKNGKDLFRAREAWGLETIKKEDGSKKKLWLPRGLTIPYSRGGVLQRVRIRRPEDHLRGENDVRYYQVPGGSGIPLVIGDRRLAYVVIETELDGMMVEQEAGDICGVVALGSSSNMPDAECHRHLSGALCILNALDFDRAGASSWPKWKAAYSSCKRWPVPCGKDPGDAYKAGVDIRLWVLAGLPPVWHVGLSPYSRKDAQGVAVESRQKEHAVVSTDSEAPEADGTGEIADSVRELGELLRRYPVRIVNTVKRMGIETPQMFRNDGVSKRVSQLVFEDPDCCAYLTKHKDELIDGRNFYHG